MSGCFPVPTLENLGHKNRNTGKTTDTLQWLEKWRVSDQVRRLRSKSVVLCPPVDRKTDEKPGLTPVNQTTTNLGLYYLFVLWLKIGVKTVVQVLKVLHQVPGTPETLEKSYRDFSFEKVLLWFHSKRKKWEQTSVHVVPQKITDVLYTIILSNLRLRLYP